MTSGFASSRRSQNGIRLALILWKFSERTRKDDLSHELLGLAPLLSGDDECLGEPMGLSKELRLSVLVDSGLHTASKEGERTL